MCKTKTLFKAFTGEKSSSGKCRKEQINNLISDMIQKRNKVKEFFSYLCKINKNNHHLV